MADGDENNDDVMDDWAEAMAEAESDQKTDVAETTAEVSSEPEASDAITRPAGFEPLKDTGGLSDKEINLDVILDVPVSVSMEIGQTKLNIRNLLQLNQGSVIELDRLAGEPLDVMVNGTLIAHGEVVVVNERYGIRLTDIISPAERVKKLN